MTRKSIINGRCMKRWLASIYVDWDNEDGKYEYEMIHISTIIRVYDYD